MANRPDPHRICTASEYRAARSELEPGPDAGAQTRRVDELLELIENYQASTRFVPDWSDESFRSAA